MRDVGMGTGRVQYDQQGLRGAIVRHRFDSETVCSDTRAEGYACTADHSQVLGTNLATRRSLRRRDRGQARRDDGTGDEVTRQDDASLKGKKPET